MTSKRQAPGELFLDSVVDSQLTSSSRSGHVVQVVPHAITAKHSTMSVGWRADESTHLLSPMDERECWRCGGQRREAANCRRRGRCEPTDCNSRATSLDSGPWLLRIRLKRQLSTSHRWPPRRRSATPRTLGTRNEPNMQIVALVKLQRPPAREETTPLVAARSGQCQVGCSSC